MPSSDTYQSGRVKRLECNDKIAEAATRNPHHFFNLATRRSGLLMRAWSYVLPLILAGPWVKGLFKINRQPNNRMQLTRRFAPPATCGQNWRIAGRGVGFGADGAPGS